MTYSCSLPAQVELYVTGYSGTLGTYLNLTVQEGTDTLATDPGCGSFTSVSTLTTGSDTLATFITHNSFGTGATAWTAAPSTSRTYRLT